MLNCHVFLFSVIKDTLSLMVISTCGTYLVCAGTCCNIAVYKSSKKTGAWSHLLNLPKYKLAPTAIAIHQNSPLLVAAFSDSKVCREYLYSLRNVFKNSQCEPPLPDFRISPRRNAFHLLFAQETRLQHHNACGQQHRARSAQRRHLHAAQ